MAAAQLKVLGVQDAILDSTFIVNRWASVRAKTGNLDADRVLTVICKKLSTIPVEHWHKLLQGDFEFANWEEINELYWGHDFRNNPEFVDWLAFRYDEFKGKDTPTFVYHRTKDHIGRYFTHHTLKNITAALLVKLYEVKGDNKEHALTGNVNKLAKLELDGAYKNIWAQQLTLSADLLKLYPLALSKVSNRV